MKRLALLCGLVMVWCGQIANAQTILTSVSLAENVAAGTQSFDYRYTRHSISSGGRGSHPYVYYTWDPYLDQQTGMSLPMVLNGSSGNATGAGTFYGPTYTATASASTTLSNTATKAVFTTSYNVTTTMNTPQVAHQKVVAGAQSGGSFYFTLTGYANVSVTATGSTNGVIRIFNQNGSGVVLGPLYGPGTMATTDNPLPPGNYRIDNSLTYGAEQDTQLNTFANLGTTNSTYNFSVTFTPGDGGD